MTGCWSKHPHTGWPKTTASDKQNLVWHICCYHNDCNHSDYGSEISQHFHPITSPKYPIIITWKDAQSYHIYSVQWVVYRTKYCSTVTWWSNCISVVEIRESQRSMEERRKWVIEKAVCVLKRGPVSVWRMPINTLTLLFSYYKYHPKRHNGRRS